MSIYTMTLQESLDYNTDNLPQLQYFGLDTFPTPTGFDPQQFRETLGQKIIDHYWNREIGLESFSMWRFNFRRLLNEQMPYFNKLYASELIKFDPLSTMNMTTTAESSSDAESNGESNSTAESTAKSRAISSSFPQTQFNSVNGNYADNGSDSLAESDNSGTGSESRTDTAVSESSSTSAGYAGSAAALLTEYRSTLLNIDMMVIDRCEECFMQVLGSGDTYTGSGYFL